jgi:hypothetical protein
MVNTIRDYLASIASDTDTMPNSSNNSNTNLLPSPRRKHQFFNMNLGHWTTIAKTVIEVVVLTSASYEFRMDRNCQDNHCQYARSILV